MSPEVNVLAIHALDELRTAFVRFGDSVDQSLMAISREIQRNQDWLEQRRQYWQLEVQIRQRWLEEARAALEDCQGSIYGDYTLDGDRSWSDCSGERAAVESCREALSAAVDELRNVRYWQDQVQQAVDEFKLEARRLSTILVNDLPKAKVRLAYSSAALRSYVAVSSSSEGVSLPSVSMIISPSRAQTTSSGRWVSQGIQNVPLDQIDVGDSNVHGPQDFLRVSFEEMKNGVLKLEKVVRPAVRAGADREYFTKMDLEQGLEGVNSYARVYDSFYGCRKPIRLGKIGSRYVVDHGYHRLFVAQQLGLESVPAEVWAPIDSE